MVNCRYLFSCRVRKGPHLEKGAKHRVIGGKGNLPIIKTRGGGISARERKEEEGGKARHGEQHIGDSRGGKVRHSLNTERGGMH